MTRSAFRSATAVTCTGEGRFRADVSPGWTIAGKPNGGYLLAILARATCLVAPQPHVLAASAHYLRSPDPGEVEVEVELLRGGRSASQLRARLIQHGLACVEGLFTVGQLAAAAPFWAAGLPAAPAAPQEDCIRLSGRTPSGAAVAMLDQIDLRVDPGTADYMNGQPSGRGEIRGWLDLPGEDFDPTALLFAVDAFPPASFDIVTTGWVPTLELTGYVRALPEPGPVRVLHRAGLITASRMDESCFVWDSSGRLVAQSVQLAGIRLA